MRGFRTDVTPIVEGHRLYYNVLRPHMGIDNRTLAEMAGLDLELGRNKIQNLIKQSAGLPR